MSLAYIPDRLADDETMPLKLRVLIEMQRRGSALDWTAPIGRVELAEVFHRSPDAVGAALKWAVDQKYLERKKASLPRGGLAWRYRTLLEPVKEPRAPAKKRPL